MGSIFDAGLKRSRLYTGLGMTIVPMLCVGMHFVTLCVTNLQPDQTAR
ncbi:hypothetical protein KPSA1_06533 [Pseudomonas syringae pv. actinidiae]|uniref:Uncharacterized protein n=1 Tax=Pseudomonas syringae pv. actinidiae TaxID=103796 RepID=A0A2V0QIW2_PSESF|nr:hypothetical protein KPSA1_06533 [Pseudomonas syringae pv. actinidiae]